MTTETQEAIACPHCGHPALEEFREFRLLHRVTSDCRPWPAGGRLCICPHCGIVQKIVDAAWRREVAEIYAGYAVYHQAEGAEQPVFDSSSGTPQPRSLRLLSALRDAVTLPRQGRMLDIGCGNGATLRAFGQLAPAWSLVGTELDDRCRRQVESLPQVEAFYTCPAEQVPGSFDVVTMIHVLEHIPAPGPFLRGLLPKLAGGGLLVLELPHHAANPCELLIADHCTHFTAASAAGLLESAGYEVLVAADDWIPKELSVVASVGSGQRAAGGEKAPRPSRPTLRVGARRCPRRGDTGCGENEEHQPPAATVRAALAWLAATAERARQLAAAGEIGLLGTSIAAAWLFAELEGAVRFFVDEDPGRVGKTYLERPVYDPSQVPQGSVVFIAQPPALAAAIARRLARPGVAYHLPPAP
jgi:SAM-dependent methyltransferase